MRSAIACTVQIELKRRGLSLGDLADACGIAYPALWRRLSVEIPTKDTARAIAAGLGMTLPDFEQLILSERAIAEIKGHHWPEPDWMVHEVQRIGG